MSKAVTVIVKAGDAEVARQRIEPGDGETTVVLDLDVRKLAKAVGDDVIKELRRGQGPATFRATIGDREEQKQKKENR